MTGAGGKALAFDPYGGHNFLYDVFCFGSIAEAFAGGDVEGFPITVKQKRKRALIIYTHTLQQFLVRYCLYDHITTDATIRARSVSSVRFGQNLLFWKDYPIYPNEVYIKWWQGLYLSNYQINYFLYAARA